MKRAELAALIDHTKLGPAVTREQVLQLCAEAREHGFASVCLPPVYVALASSQLAASPVKVCAVIGFPHGHHLPEVKALEAQRALEQGAQELDMVVNVAALQARDYAAVLQDVQAVCRVGHQGPQRACVKVILETALLTREEKVAGCIVASSAGADYVKTSTGFGPGGATPEDVTLLREVVGGQMGVKAAGGIKDYATAVKMVQAGASRLGASAGVAILAGAPE